MAENIDNQKLKKAGEKVAESFEKHQSLIKKYNILEASSTDTEQLKSLLLEKKLSYVEHNSAMIDYQQIEIDVKLKRMASDLDLIENVLKNVDSVSAKKTLSELKKIQPSIKRIEKGFEYRKSFQDQTVNKLIKSTIAHHNSNLKIVNQLNLGKQKLSTLGRNHLRQLHQNIAINEKISNLQTKISHSINRLNKTRKNTQLLVKFDVIEDQFKQIQNTLNKEYDFTEKENILAEAQKNLKSIHTEEILNAKKFIKHPDIHYRIRTLKILYEKVSKSIKNFEQSFESDKKHQDYQHKNNLYQHRITNMEAKFFSGKNSTFNAYLEERHQTYWLKDLFSKYAATVLGYFGYQTDSDKRELYTQDLEEKFNEYKNNPDAYESLQEKIAEGKKQFSPRATKGDEFKKSLQYKLNTFQKVLEKTHQTIPQPSEQAETGTPRP